MPSSASTDGAKVGQLPTGTEVEVLSQKDGWYKVVGGNYTGYVSAQYITLDSQSATTTFVKVTNGPLNVRSGPGTENEAIASLVNGNDVTIKADAGNGWYEITFVGNGGVDTDGYVKGEFLANK